MPSQPSRWRRIALRTAVVGFLLLAIVATNVVLLFPLFSWLPSATLRDVGLPDDVAPHLVHGVGIGLTRWVLLLCLVLQLRRPQRWVAPLWIFAFVHVTGIVFDLVRWDIDDVIWFLVYALFFAVVALHPRRTARIGAVDRPVLLVALVGAVPFAAYVWLELRLQFGPADPFGHVDDNHYFTMAALAGLVIVAALLGATEVPGAPLTAWMAGGVALLLGVASLAHPDQASALPAGWALAAMGWAVGYVVTVAIRRRHPALVDDEEAMPAGRT
jgi:hypothetical protein